MQHLYDNIPALLKLHPNWVAWGVRGAPLKSPYDPGSLLRGAPSPAKAGVPHTWGCYQDSVDCVSQGLAQGVGYEFDGGGLFGADLDNVIDDAGGLAPQARDIVERLDSYTEKSPSGKGLHIFVLSSGADIARHRKKGHFLEIYGNGRYFTVTGDVFYGKGEICSRTAGLQAVHDEYLLPEAPQKSSPLPAATAMRDPGHERFLQMGLCRDKVFAALWAGQRRHGDESADDIALMNKLAYWCNADPDAMARAFLSSPYHAQKDEAHRRKCQRCDYLRNTAYGACATVYSTAAADHERWQQGRRRERGHAR